MRPKKKKKPKIVRLWFSITIVSSFFLTSQEMGLCLMIG